MSDTFLYKKGFEHASFIVIREILDQGEYFVFFNSDDGMSFANSEGIKPLRC